MPEVVKYIGERYVPIFYDNPDTGTPQWKSEEEYEPLTIVINNSFSYTSKRHVPAGIDILNTDYWVLTGQFDAQVQSLYELLQATIDMLEQNTFGQDWNFYAFGYKDADSGTPDGEHSNVYKQTSDCNVIVNPDGKVLMIDSGWELGNNNMQAEFVARGITRVDAVVISHFHLDHAGGFNDMANYLTFDENTTWYLPEKLTALDSTDSPQIYQLETQVLALIARTGGQIVRPTEGESFTFYGATLTFYNTVLDRWRDFENDGHIAVYNDTSVVCMIQIGKKKVFYTGDAEYQLQAYLATLPALDGCDIMKFSHHGANRSYYDGFYYRMHPSATFATNGKDWTNTDLSETVQRTVLTMLQSFSGEFYMYNKMGVPVYATSSAEGYILHFTVNRKAYQFYTNLYNHSRNEPLALLGCLYDTESVIKKSDIEDWYRNDPDFIADHQYLQGRNIFQAPTIDGYSPITMGKFLDSLPDNGIFMCRLTNTYNKMLIFDDGASIVIVHKTSSANFRNSYKDSPTAAVKSYVVMDYCTAVGSDPTQVDGRYGTNPICHRVVGNKLSNGEWVFSSVPINGSNFIFFMHEFAAGSNNVVVPVLRDNLTYQMNRDFGLTGANNQLYNIRTAVLFEVTCRATVTGSCDIKVKIGDQNIGRIIHGSSGRDHVCNTFVAKPSSSGTSAVLTIEGSCENAVGDFHCLIKPLSYNYSPTSYLINEE